MDNHSYNSHSKSVVFPRIKADQKHNDWQRTSHDNVGAKFSRYNFKDECDDFSKYILDRLGFVERALEEERRERSILKDHVKGLSSNLQRLSKDMAALQNQLRSDENTTHSQTVPLKNLGMHQVSSGMGDVWNRLTLGDLNTIKLSGDLNQLSGEVADLKRNQEHFKKNYDEVWKDVQKLVTEVEKSSLEFEKKIQLLKGEIDPKITRMNQNLETMAIQNDKLEKRHIQVDGSNYSGHMVKSNYLEVLNNFELRFNQLMETQASWKQGINKWCSVIDENLLQVKETERKNYEELTRMMNDLKTNQNKSFEQCHQGIKTSYQEAFLAVYESITTMQAVLETKLKMTEADLKTSINSILKTIPHKY